MPFWALHEQCDRKNSQEWDVNSVDLLVDRNVSVYAIGKYSIFPVDSGQLRLYLIIANKDVVSEQFDSHYSSAVW